MPHRILAIDDSIALRVFISKTLALRADEFAVTTAKDGREGIALASSSKPDLILLDYILPDMTGGDVCATLIKEESTGKIPVVLMSSNAADIKKAEAIYKNIVKSIAKPFTPGMLTSTVRQMLRSTEDTVATPSTSPVVKKPQPPAIHTHRASCHDHSPATQVAPVIGGSPRSSSIRSGIEGRSMAPRPRR